MQNENNRHWLDWLDELNEVALKAGCGKDLVSVTGRECWRDYFDDGLTAELAFEEDLTHL